ncbi:efflux RND transporter periplasmic adaptor subunit [Calothrix sp. 336/3]|uniref:efflux RND transporter periplasmic adaptor subunit n=1 Tax=Calothrix sp. 336/3 TaxID=1337936 RepID=UPI0004E36E47|nr:efflux RND transporter periplasmic adaptor subunit [Calothrix sp. 336/3]AKG24684.1 RND transporter [Calothrix sp. 336/3]
MGEESTSELETQESVAVRDVQREIGKTNRQLAWLSPLLLGTGLGLAIAFGGTQIFSQRSATSSNPTTKKPQVANPTMTVTVIAVGSNSIAKTLNATGTVAARDLIPVLPQSNGLQIKQVLVNEGDNVKAGQLLAILDDSVLQSQITQARADFESTQADVASRKATVQSQQAAVTSSQAIVQQRKADLAQSQARLQEAEKNYQRYEKLVADGAISQQELDSRQTTVTTAREAVRLAQENIRSAEANVASARAAVGTARANLSSAEAEAKSSAAKITQFKTQLAQTLVRAPVAGVIAEKLVRVGDVTGVPPQTQVGTLVGGSQKLFSIIRNGKLELQASVPTVQLNQVREGAAVQVTSDVNPRIRLRGTVREIIPVVDDKRREATVKIDLPGTSWLKPGMFARAAINTSTVLGVAVPQKVVVPQPDGSAIAFILSGEDTVRAQKVELGEVLNNGKVEIKNGLQAGDRVVNQGAGYLKDGDKVRVVSTPGNDQ